MNEIYVLESQKENLHSFHFNRTSKGRTAGYRSFGKEVQNVKAGEVTPVKKASRVNGNLTPEVRERTVSIIESFTLEPQHVNEYQKEIIQYLKSNEASYQVNRNYMAQQSDINTKMRGILIDWLVDVNLKFKLLPQCLFLSINLLDRFLAATQINRQQLQLAGVTCLMISAKFEEIYPPMLKDYICVCDNTYSKKEILEMEGLILQTLDFNVTQTSSFAYLKMFNSRLKMDDNLFVFARYLLENALLDVNSLKHDNCSLAAGAIFLVNKIFKKGGWSAEFEEITTISEEAVKLAAKDLYLMMQRAEANGLTALVRKFSVADYFEVSKFKIVPNQNKN
jgi:hypothetical protein